MTNLNPVVPIVEPLKSWRSLKRQLAHGADFQETHRDNQHRILETYVATGRIVHKSLITDEEEVVEQPSRSTFLGSPLAIIARSTVIDGCRGASSVDGQGVFSSAVLYEEYCSLQDFLIESEFPARHGRNLKLFTAQYASWLGLAAATGAMEVVGRWAPLLVAATRNGYSLDHDSLGMQHWILRLWCKVHELDYPNTGYPHYDFAEGILDAWDTEDVDSLAAWLEQLCNLHTRLAASKQCMDFANDFSHFPVEVLMLFRLRERTGLPNPEVNHPIMKFPWSRLWPLKPAKPDELLAGVYRHSKWMKVSRCRGCTANFSWCRSWIRAVDARRRQQCRGTRCGDRRDQRQCIRAGRVSEVWMNPDRLEEGIGRVLIL